MTTTDVNTSFLFVGLTWCPAKLRYMKSVSSAIRIRSVNPRLPNGVRPSSGSRKNFLSSINRPLLARVQAADQGPKGTDGDVYPNRETRQENLPSESCEKFDFREMGNPARQEVRVSMAHERL